MLPVFIVDELPDKGEIFVSGDEAHHAINVTRIKVNEIIALTDGKGRRVSVEVTSIAKKSFSAKILTVEDFPVSRIWLTVMQALTKGDRARETIELLTEAGVDEIIPWSANRSIGQFKDEQDSLDKWRTWARESTKQSRRAWFPKISNLKSGVGASEMLVDFDLTLLFHESDGGKLSDLLSKAQGEKNPSRVLLIIGPEGGISDEEAGAFLAHGARPVAMGLPIFRSAHAGAAALAAVQTGLGIW
jgi:16S rRNA (uracil1498-N3)-methyltransferase